MCTNNKVVFDVFSWKFILFKDIQSDSRWMAYYTLKENWLRHFFKCLYERVKIYYSQIFLATWYIQNLWKYRYFKWKDLYISQFLDSSFSFEVLSSICFWENNLFIYFLKNTTEKLQCFLASKQLGATIWLRLTMTHNNLDIWS